MPIKKIRVEDIPKSRFQNSSLYEVNEWKEAIPELERLSKSLNPLEALEFTLSPDTIASLPLKDPHQSAVIAFRRLIKSRGMPLIVIKRKDPFTGREGVYIQLGHTKDKPKKERAKRKKQT